MPEILVPVDGSAASLNAVLHTIKLHKDCPAMRILLVNVQPPPDSWELKSHLRAAEIEAMQETRGGDTLAAARALLDAAGAPYRAEVLLGPVAETLVAHATETGCDRIVMGSKGETFIEEAVTGSVAHEVLRLSEIPVTFVK
ncbi:MAG: universal stress protein [Rhodocyclaceae bacterium]|nr:universal stress protein [Rhodocyclaceae bacterium]